MKTKFAEICQRRVGVFRKFLLLISTSDLHVIRWIWRKRRQVRGMLWIFAELSISTAFTLL